MQVKNKYNKLGDLGLVAAKMAKSTRTLYGAKEPKKQLTAHYMLERYLLIAKMSGKNSQVGLSEGKINQGTRCWDYLFKKFLVCMESRNCALRCVSVKIKLVLLSLDNYMLSSIDR